MGENLGGRTHGREPHRELTRSSRRAAAAAISRLSLALLLVGLMALITASGAAAHATLARSEPADGAVLPKAPTELRLWFTEDISPRFRSVEVSDLAGRAVEVSLDPAKPDQPELLSTRLPRLRNGTYSISWKVLSDEDGHFRQGLLVFGLGSETSAEVAAAVAARRADPLAPNEIVLRWLNVGLLASAVALLGVATARRVMRRRSPAWPALGLTAAAPLLVWQASRLPGALPVEETLRWINLTLLASIVGSLAICVVLAGGRSPDEGPARAARLGAQERALAWAAWTGAFGLLAGAGVFVWQATKLADTLPGGGSLAEALWQLGTNTRWGALWLLRESFLLGLVGVALALRRIQSGQGLLGSRDEIARAVWPAATLLSLALMTTQALTGHAASVESRAALAVGADALHLLAAAVWIGGLQALIVALWPLRGGSVAFKRACWRRFARLAALSVGVLAATGLYGAARQVDSVDGLFTTLYGGALLSKTGLVLAAGMFALGSSVLLRPRLAAKLARLFRRPNGWTPVAPSRLPRLLVAEALIGLLILLAAGVLTAAVPARGPGDPGQLRTAVSQSVDDLLVTFSAKPNRPGDNVFTALAVSTRRPAPADVEQVALRFTPEGDGEGSRIVQMQQVEPGRFRAGGSQLDRSGSWSIAVLVRRSGLKDSEARLDWAVAEPGPPPGTVLSRRPLAPFLIPAALVLGLGVLLLATWYWVLPLRSRRRRSSESVRAPIPLREAQ